MCSEQFSLNFDCAREREGGERENSQCTLVLTAIFLAVYINSMVVAEAALHHTSIFTFVMGDNQSFKPSFTKISHSRRMLLPT